MAKRVVVKEGDVFCVEIENVKKRYFQYITKDSSQLDSAVICVFKKEYIIDATPSIDDIVTNEVEFYAHTFIQYGLKSNAWYKVGNSKYIQCFKNVYFKANEDDRVKEIPRKWYTWRINKSEKDIGMISDVLFEKLAWGLIFPPPNILNRLITGHYIGVFGEETLDGYIKYMNSRGNF